MADLKQFHVRGWGWHVARGRTPLTWIGFAHTSSEALQAASQGWPSEYTSVSMESVEEFSL